MMPQNRYLLVEDYFHNIRFADKTGRVLGKIRAYSIFRSDATILAQHKRFVKGCDFCGRD